MILAVREGDPEAREELAQWLLSELMGFFSSSFGENDADELTQRTITALFTKLDSAPLDPAKMGGWARSFAVLEARSHRRELERERARSAKREDLARVKTPPRSLDAQLLARERRMLLEGYVETLPAKYQRILELHLAGYDYPTISDHLDIPEGTARSAVSQVRRRFKLTFGRERVTQTQFRSPEKAS